MADFEINVIRDKGTEDEFSSCPRVCEYLEFLAQRLLGTPCSDHLIDPNELIVKESTITITFNYPLTNSIKLTFTNPGGFTRFDFFRCVYEGYLNIYKQEESVDCDPGMMPGMLNRAKSDGPYGIWGHVIEDLFLEGVEDKGNGNYELIIGS